MSLPRPRPLDQRQYLRSTGFRPEPNRAAVMPAILKLRAAGDDRFAIDDALEQIPVSVLPDVALFAGERADIIGRRGMVAVLSRIGFDTFTREVGTNRGCNVWRRYTQAEQERADTGSEGQSLRPEA